MEWSYFIYTLNDRLVHLQDKDKIPNLISYMTFFIDYVNNDRNTISPCVLPGQIMGTILERYHCGACRDKLWPSFLRDITVVLTFKCPCCLFIFTYFVSQTLLTLTVNLLWFFACCRLPVTLFTRERNGYWSLIYFILFYSFYCGNCKNATRLIDPCCQPLKTQFSWIIGIFYKIVLFM